MARDKVQIRPLHKDDAGRIGRILQVAFEDEYRRMGQKSTRLPTMTDRLLDYYMGRISHYSFAAEKKGGVIGFCLACRWGKTAWMGPIAILPPAQGDGIGRRLVERSTAELRRAGVTTLGVETMPRSYRNLQFYSSLGMVFAGMTLDLSCSSLLKSETGGRQRGIEDLSLVSLSDLNDSEKTEAFERIAEISDRVSPGLDYRPEVEATFRFQIGDVLLLFWHGQAAGFAIVHTQPYAKEEIAGTVRVNTMLIKPSEEGMPPVDRMCEDMVLLTENWIIRERYDAAIFRVPVRYNNVRDYLIKRGYSISHSDIRMTYQDLKETDNPGAVHLSKWE